MTGPLLREAAATLAAAGIQSSTTDARLLAAHVLAVEPLLVPLTDVTAAQEAVFRKLISQRAQRIPLQHLTGEAWLGPARLVVGPGVFIPRPETELLWQWAVAEIAHLSAPVVVDLCSGSGALALALALAVPTATVTAVEREAAALDYLRRNVASHDLGERVQVIAGDATTDLAAQGVPPIVDLVVANPPYIPVAAQLDAEVLADPATALFGGADGMAVITPMVARIAEILRPGGAVGIEHDDSNGALTAAALRQHGFTDVTAHQDLAQRPRWVTAHRAAG